MAVRSIPFPIQWHEGMLLSPQHLQLLESSVALSQATHWACHSSTHYGIDQLTIDSILLNKGIFRIVEVSGIFRDGLIFTYQAEKHQNLLPLELDLNPLKPSDKRQKIGWTICLAISPFSSEAIVGDSPRYLSVEGESVPDLNVPENVISVPRLMPKIFLCIDENCSPNLLHIPIAKIEYGGEIFTRLPYTLPCFYCEPHGTILTIAMGLVSQMRQKITALIDRSQNQVGTPLARETMNLLQPILMALPELEGLLGLSQISPIQLYQVLMRTFGLLLPLKTNIIPPSLSPYSHNQIDQTLLPLMDLIQSLLNSVEEGFLSVPFSQKDRRFYLTLQPVYATKRFLILVRTQKGMTESELEDWMEDAIIATDQAIEEVVSRRITGAKRKKINDFEMEELNPTRGVLIYELMLPDPFVDFKTPSTNLNIVNPADQPEKRPAEITFYQLKK
jgi:type VI secretion system protein ImpJ